MFIVSEFWDIYDSERNPTGRTVERGKPMGRDEYHIVVNVWIKNSKGQWLISKRTPNKHFPLLWEPTGGSVVAGENSFDAALRETREELGIKLDPKKGKLFVTAKRQYREFPDFLDVWVFRHDCDIASVTFQPGETCGAMWASSAEIKNLAASGKFVPQNVFPYLDKLFAVYG